MSRRGRRRGDGGWRGEGREGWREGQSGRSNQPDYGHDNIRMGGYGRTGELEQREDVERRPYQSDDYGRGSGYGRSGDYERGGSWRQGGYGQQGDFERQEFGGRGGGRWQGGDYGRGGRMAQMGDYERGGDYERMNDPAWEARAGYGHFGGTAQMGGTWGQRSGGGTTGTSTMRGQYTGRGPRGYQRSDDRIREDVCDVLTMHGEVDASDIEVQVSGGDVTLTGTVQDRQMKRMAEDAIESVSGVREIHNQLRVSRVSMGHRQGQTDQWHQAAGGMTGAGAQDWNQASSGFRQDWEQRYGQSGRRWQEVEPGYRYGYEIARDPRYSGRQWQEIESEAQSNYATWARQYGYGDDQSGWERLRESVREGWQRVTGQQTH
jgi:hypothetical protein